MDAEKRATGVLSLTFNQDNTCVCLSTQQGILIYNLESKRPCFRHDVGAISLTEMLFCTSILAYVGAGEQPALTPRKLSVLNTSTNKVVSELSFPTSVLAVRMNRLRLVAVTDKRSCVYSMQDLSLLRTIDSDNPKGCCAITVGPDNNLLALPASAEQGTVRVYDLLQDASPVLCEVHAHQQPVAIMAWSQDGSMLATASAKGTVLRVHRLPHTPRAYTLRRGTTSASITSLAFSPPGLAPPLLAACSSHGTVHVFKLEAREQRHPASAAASAAAGFLSAMVNVSMSDMWEPPRSFAQISLPRGHAASACAVQPLPRGSVSSRDGSAGMAGSSGRGAAGAAGGLELGLGLGSSSMASLSAAGGLAPPSSSSSGGPASQSAHAHPSGDTDLYTATTTGGGGMASSASALGSGGGADMAVGSSGRGQLGLASDFVACGREEGTAEDGTRIVVATDAGMLYEYVLSDMQNPQGPKCALEGEWALLGSGSIC